MFMTPRADDLAIHRGLLIDLSAWRSVFIFALGRSAPHHDQRLFHDSTDSSDAGANIGGITWRAATTGLLVLAARDSSPSCCKAAFDQRVHEPSATASGRADEGVLLHSGRRPSSFSTSECFPIGFLSRNLIPTRVGPGFSTRPCSRRLTEILSAVTVCLAVDVT